MTAPSVLPSVPTTSRAGSRPTASSSPDSAPAFASALGSALQTTRDTARDTRSDDAVGNRPRSDRPRADASDRTPARDDVTTPTTATDAATTEPADGDRPAEGTEPAAEPAVAVPLPPGLWALLAAATPVATAPAGDAADPAAVLTAGVVVAAASAAATDPLVDGLPVTGAPSTGPAAGAPAAGLPAAAAPDVTTAATTAATALTGLTVVLDPAPADVPGPATGPAPAPAPPAAGQTPLLLPPPAWAGTSAGTPDGSSGEPATPTAAAAEAPAAAIDTDPAFTLGGAAPTASTAQAAAATASPVPQPPVAEQLGRHLAVLRSAPDGSQTMTVVVTPDDLGPVTIAVTVSDGTLDLTLQGAHDASRRALLDALPDLRRDLEGAGLSLSSLEVDTTSGDAGPGSRSAQQQLLDARAGQQGSGQPGQQAPRGRAWGAAPEHLTTGTPTTDTSTSSGVDVRV
ncbi:flagellar hook-length control protein FliK [Modestobacter muralis]